MSVRQLERRVKRENRAPRGRRPLEERGLERQRLEEELQHALGTGRDPRLFSREGPDRDLVYSLEDFETGRAAARRRTVTDKYRPSWSSRTTSETSGGCGSPTAW
jgi:hypothetical protein